MELPTDVNDDGFTTALDALQCVNALNTDGSRSLASSEARFGSFFDESFYVDVNSPLNLHAVLPRLTTNFDWDATREIFRNRFFARIADTTFLDDVLE